MMDSANAALAGRVAEECFGVKSVAVRRFPTGLCHYVFEVTLDGGRQVVVRMARPESDHLLAGAVFWERRLRDVGVPVARILSADLSKVRFPYAYLVLERLAGEDLEVVYPGLSTGAKVSLARRMAALQRAVAALAPAGGFGDALSYALPGTGADWGAVVAANLATCRARLGPNSVFGPADLGRLAHVAGTLASDFSAIEPRAFLDDATTKNVIVTVDGCFSGIVDVDTLCFGDPLFALGLTKAAFTKLGYDELYVEVWAAELALSGPEQRRLSFYSALFAVVLLSEHGLRFNRPAAVAIADAGVARLRGLVDSELGD